MTCPGCGEEFDDFDRESKYCRALDITVCEQCAKRIEELHKIKGKFTVIRCKCCKHLLKLKYTPYKKRGRAVGSKNKPKPGVPRQTVLVGEGQTAMII